jgi:starch-binding outer membrane protein, SusD/RagB family
MSHRIRKTSFLSIGFFGGNSPFKYNYLQMKQISKQLFKSNGQVHCEPTVNDQQAFIPCNNQLTTNCMKKNIQKIGAMVMLLSMLYSCTNLDVDVKSSLTASNFPKTTEDFISVSGPVYSSLTAESNNGNGFWMISQLSGDEAILTANGGNWYDGGKYKELHMHAFTPANVQIGYVWSWGFNGINTCNRVLKLFDAAEDNSARQVAIAEIKSVRAYYYYLMMDLFGGVPLVTTFGDTSTQERKTRTEIYNFVETELKAAIPYLKTTVSSTTYGRPTKWMAYALLAKLYLNAAVYTGTSKYTEAVSACDSIITEATANKTFALDADYLKMFKPSNGSSVKDFIFAIPYDCNNTVAGIYVQRYWLSSLQKTKYSLPYNPSGCLRTLPTFYGLFNDANDIRNKMWLTGKQYYYDGTPITVATTKKGVDATYTGSDASASVTWQLEFTPDVTFLDLNSFNTGDDQLCRAKGYRCIKFYPDSTSTTRSQSNDMPVFRYADILLMKAEAILRGATASLGQTPLSLVNQVRDRAKATRFTTVDLNTLLDERGRELCFENWRRNDLIRFGKFEDAWGVKTDNNVQKRLFPIPADQITLNPALIQNPGY